MNGLWASLDNKELSRDPVLGKLHIHRAAIVPLDGHAPDTQGFGILFGDGVFMLLGGG